MKGVSQEGTLLIAVHTKLLGRYAYDAVHTEVTKAIIAKPMTGWGIFYQQ